MTAAESSPPHTPLPDAPTSAARRVAIACGVGTAIESIVACAHWSDRWGRRRMMVAGLSALGLWSVVFFPLADTRSVPLVGVALAVMMILQGPYMGAQPAVFSELF